MKVPFKVVKQRILWSVATLTFIISVIVIAGWVLESEKLLQIISGGRITMRFNTALFFFLTGICLLLIPSQSSAWRIVNVFLSTAVTIGGAITLTEYFTEQTINIDNIVVEDTLSARDTLPGRMSGASAICFMLLGISILMTLVRIRFFNVISHYFLLVVQLIAIISIVSIILQISIHNEIFFWHTMALQTAVLFLTIAFAISLEHSSLGFTGLLMGEYEGSKLMRLLLPYMVVVPMLLSYLFLAVTGKDLVNYNFAIAIYTVSFITLSIIYISAISIGLNKSDLHRRELEDSLYKSNQELWYFNVALDSTSVVAATDSRGVINYVNDKFCETSKYSREELIGKTHAMINSGYHSRDFFKNLYATIRSGNIWVGEIKNKNKDGEYYWMYTSIVPFKNSMGEIYRYLSIRQDITHRKETEELLKEYVRRLEQKNKELEQFTYIASHDLQEPLRTVTSFVDLLEEEYKGVLDEEANQYLSFISKATVRMRDLIKGLLDYSRIGGVKDREPVDCNQVIKEIQEDLIVSITETGATFEIDRLPVITAYPVEMRLLFQNLISNALKFRKRNIPVKIKITANKEGTCWKFSISDNGIGIEEKHKDKIFLIFKRLHNRSLFEGSGIGLAHCLKIVQFHGGEIWVDSVVGQGSTFHFTIPLTQARVS